MLILYTMDISIYTQDYSGMFKTCILFVCPAMLLAWIQSVDYSAYLKFQRATSKPSKQEGKFLVCLVYGLGRPGGQISLVNPRRRCPAIIVADQNRPPLWGDSAVVENGKTLAASIGSSASCTWPYIHSSIQLSLPTNTERERERERDVHIHISCRKQHGYRIFPFGHLEQKQLSSKQ